MYTSAFILLFVLVYCVCGLYTPECFVLRVPPSQVPSTPGMALKGATGVYEPTLQLPQMIVALSVLSSAATVQWRIRKVNAMGDEIEKARELLKEATLSQLDGVSDKDEVEYYREELAKKEEEALRLKTLISVPGGPTLRFRVVDRTVRSLDSTLDADTPEDEMVQFPGSDDEEPAFFRQISRNSLESGEEPGALGLSAIARNSAGVFSVISLVYLLFLLSVDPTPTLQALSQ